MNKANTCEGMEKGVQQSANLAQWQDRLASLPFDLAPASFPLTKHLHLGDCKANLVAFSDFIKKAWV